MRPDDSTAQHSTGPVVNTTGTQRHSKARFKALPYRAVDDRHKYLEHRIRLRHISIDPMLMSQIKPALAAMPHSLGGA